MEGSNPAAAPEALAAWLRTTGALVSGLNHAFSNRLSSLTWVAFRDTGGGGIAPGAEGVVATATERLAQLLRLYRLLEPTDVTPPEATPVSDIIPEAFALLGNHPTLRDISRTMDGDPKTPPVLLAPAALAQGVLLLLCGALQASGGDEATGVHVRYQGDPDWVTITVETRSPVPRSDAVNIPELSLVPWLVRGASASATAERKPDGGVRVEMRLATLASIRRRERGG